MLSWLQTLSLLLLLALNTAFQPVGRVLGISAHYAIYLRFSPLVCAADALSFIIHLLTYCFVPGLTARQALVLIARERFDEAEIYPRDTKSFRSKAAYGLKLAAHVLWFVFGVFRSLFVVSLWAGRWMAAWALMYAIPYAVLGVASWYMRQQLADLQDTPLTTSSNEGTQDLEDGIIKSPAATDNDETQDLEDGVIKSPAPTDTEQFPSSDIPALKDTLAQVHTFLLWLSAFLHTLLLFYLLFTLLQPLLNQHILSATAPSLTIPLSIISLPLIYAVLAAALVLCILIGAIFLAIVGAAATAVKRLLPEGPGIAVLVDVLFFGAAGCAAMVGFFEYWLVVVQVGLNEQMLWIYRAIAVDAVVVVLIAGVCLFWYFFLRGMIESQAAVIEKSEMASYLNEESTGLLMCWLISLVLVVLWFRFRYEPSG